MTKAKPPGLPLARNLRELRRARNFTQDELARRAQLHRQTVINLESADEDDTPRATVDTIRRLAQALGTSPATLLDDPSLWSSTTRFLHELRAVVSRISAPLRDAITKAAKSVASIPETTR